MSLNRFKRTSLKDKHDAQESSVVEKVEKVAKKVSVKKK